MIPIRFFPAPLRAVSSWLPFEHIAYTPLQIYLGKLTVAEAGRKVMTQWAWVALLLWLGALWWRRATRKITIHGG